MIGISKDQYSRWLSGQILYNRRHEWEWGRYAFKYEHRSTDNAMGRFGGGWDWELGFQASRNELIVNMLVASLRIYRMRPCAVCGEWVRRPCYVRIAGKLSGVHGECRK
ncbi:hypothetical protein ACWGLC_16045 [Dietzia sp. NPDC055877]